SERLILSNASLRISTISSASMFSFTCTISFCISASDVPLMDTTTFGSPSHISMFLMFILIPRQSSCYLLYCTHTSLKIKVPKIPGEGFWVRGLDQRGMVKLMFIVGVYPLIIKLMLRCPLFFAEKVNFKYKFCLLRYNEFHNFHLQLNGADAYKFHMTSNVPVQRF